MSDGSIIREYLDQLDAQLETVVQMLDDTAPAKLWDTPTLETWSIGEQLYHLTAWLRCYRRRLELFYRAFYPVGWLLRNRPYPVEIDDVFSRPRYPNYVGFLCAPRHIPDRSLALGTLIERLSKGHDLVREFYVDKPERILGHVWLYDTAIGWVNLIQSLRIAVYHDQHHFDKIGELCVTSVDQDTEDELL